MSDPHLRIVPDIDWEKCLRKHGITEKTVAYWRIFGVPPRAFYDGKGTIFVEASSRDNRRLLMHEYAHAIKYPGHEHPTSPIAGILHAIRVGFDCRAFTGLLRWRSGPKALVRQYETWRSLLAAL